MITLMDFLNLGKNVDYTSLNESIQFHHGAKYGQIVVMAGGPASGKGFVKDTMLDASTYKVRDVDSFKTKYLKLLKQKANSLDQEFSEEELKILKPFIEKHKLNITSLLGDSELLSLLHEFVKKRINITINVNEINNKFHDDLNDWYKNAKTKSENIKESFLDWYIHYIKKISNRSITSIVYSKEIKSLKNQLNDLESFDVKSFSDRAYDLFKDILSNEDDFPKDIHNMIKSFELTNTETLPNLLFDITFKDTWYLDSIIPKLFEVGYKPENVHLVWVVVDLEEAKKRNAGRQRVVKERIVETIHANVIKNFFDVLSSPHFIPDVVNGDIYIIDNKNLSDLDDIKSERVKVSSKNIAYDRENKTDKSFILKNISAYRIKKANDPKIDKNQIRSILNIIKNNLDYLNNNKELIDTTQSAKNHINNILQEGELNNE